MTTRPPICVAGAQDETSPPHPPTTHTHTVLPLLVYIVITWPNSVVWVLEFTIFKFFLNLNVCTLTHHTTNKLCTFACHALMVPCLFRRARKGFQGPEYQLEAVELAVMRWSSISPLSIPRGTEQPEAGHSRFHIKVIPPPTILKYIQVYCP